MEAETRRSTAQDEFQSAGARQSAEPLQGQCRLSQDRRKVLGSQRKHAARRSGTGEDRSGGSGVRRQILADRRPKHEFFGEIDIGQRRRVLHLGRAQRPEQVGDRAEA